MMRSIHGKIFFTAAALLLAAVAHSADTDSKTTERCIQISRIDHTEIVDDQNIIFHMRGGKTYNNHLPQRCNQLTLGGAFKFATSQTQLCNVDIISVLDRSTAEAIPGASCGLGMFEKIDAKQKPAQTKPAAS